MDPREINLMALDAVILQKKLFMPVTGPPLVHNLGPYLRLKKQRGFTNNLKDLFHPVVFFFLEIG